MEVYPLRLLTYIWYLANKKGLTTRILSGTTSSPRQTDIQKSKDCGKFIYIAIHSVTLLQKFCEKLQFQKIYMFLSFYIFFAKGTETVRRDSNFIEEVIGSNFSMEQFKLKSS